MVNNNKGITNLFLALSLCAITAVYTEVSANELTPGSGATLAIAERPNSDFADDDNRFLQEKKRSIVRDAATAIQACEIASRFLNAGDLTMAKASIEWAKQKLNGLKVAIPDAPMIPIDAQGKLIHLSTDVKRLKTLQEKVKELVANNNYQAARPLIDMMADEMRVRMVLLPINQFTGEVQTISELIGSGYISRAKVYLHDVMDELVVKEEMVPIPLLRAEELVAEASKLNMSPVISKVSSTETHEMVKAALEQLKIAEMLGYGASQDYASMNATAQQMSKEKNTGLFLNESRRFLEEVEDFKHKLSYMAVDTSGHNLPPGQENIPEAKKIHEFLEKI